MEILNEDSIEFVKTKLIQVKRKMNSFTLIFISFTDPPKIIPILITLVTIEGGSEDLLVQVTKEMEMLEMHLNINITLQNVDRFGECICEQHHMLFMNKKSF